MKNNKENLGFWEQNLNPITMFGRDRAIVKSNYQKSNLGRKPNLSGYGMRKELIQKYNIKSVDFHRFMKKNEINDYVLRHNTTVFYKLSYFEFFLSNFVKEEPKKQEPLPDGFISRNEVMELTGWSAWMFWKLSKNLTFVTQRIGSANYRFYDKKIILEILDKKNENNPKDNNPKDHPKDNPKGNGN